MRATLILATAAVLATSPVYAGDRTGYGAIASGDLSAAERTLAAERRIYPDHPELMLNLAAVYQRTGRSTAAAALYRDVLTRPAVTMDMPSGAIRSSHDIATLALAHLAPTTVAAR